MKKTVVKQINGMTGLEVAGVNLRIEDVLTPEEYLPKPQAEEAQPEEAPAAEAPAAAAEEPTEPAPEAE